MAASPRIYELRTYTLHPGRRDELISLFEREFVESQHACGIRLDGLFRDPGRPDRFIWIRSFPDMEARRTALAAFYGGEVWNRHRDAANATMIDSDDVLLLKGAPSLETTTVRGPLYCAIYSFTDDGAVAERLSLEGARIVARFVTEQSENTFPQLPVREGAFVTVVLFDGADRDQVMTTNPSEVFELVPTERSPLRLEHAGSPDDFAFLRGDWKVAHRILKSRLTGCEEWEQCEGSARAMSFLDGIVSTDEITVGNGVKGCSFRHLDLQRRRWTIHWVNNRTGELMAPVSGGFKDGRGEFYGFDEEGGVPVVARYIWSNCDTAHPRWEQAFSVDGGRSWETNWIMEFRR